MARRRLTRWQRYHDPRRSPNRRFEIDASASQTPGPWLACTLAQHPALKWIGRSGPLETAPRRTAGAVCLNSASFKAPTNQRLLRWGDNAEARGRIQLIDAQHHRQVSGTDLAGQERPATRIQTACRRRPMRQACHDRLLRLLNWTRNPAGHAHKSPQARRHGGGPVSAPMLSFFGRLENGISRCPPKFTGITESHR